MAYNYASLSNGPMHPLVSGMTSMLAEGPQSFNPLQSQAGNFNMMPMAGMNDTPLEFNMKKNQPPQPIDTHSQDIDIHGGKSVVSGNNRRGRNQSNNQGNGVSSGRENRDTDKRRHERSIPGRSDLRLEARNTPERGRHTSESSIDVPLSNTVTVGTDMAINQQSMMYTGMMGAGMGGYMVMSGMGGVMMDPSMMTMSQFPMPTMPTMTSAEQNMMPVIGNVKEIIHCKSCTLIPPNPNAPLPTTRERPNGCRTIFVGGLPENITESIIQEVFERCGEITTLRLSKKNFCHIRFVFEHSVDAAIYLSGYRIRLGTNTDLPNCGRLHVDFAQARDDQYEYECRQRQLQREQRHREKMERDRCRPLSPPPVVHYTDHEAAAVAEKIKQDESFSKAVQVVITWLERGDCSKRNSNSFYSMIQSTNSHIRRLMNEKTQYEEEMQKAKEQLKVQMQGVMIQFNQIEKVFVAACHKKVWDHFTKAQRKNIEMWKKQVSELRKLQMEEDFTEAGDDEMDVSDIEEDIPRKKIKTDNSDDKLKEENDSLRCQLEAYKNEVDLLRSDMKNEIDHKEKQSQLLQETIKNLQQELMENRKKQMDENNRIRELESKLKSANVRELLLKTKIVDATKGRCDNDEDKNDKQSDIIDVEESNNKSEFKLDNISDLALSDTEAKNIGVISTFLNVHPFGASTDYIWSYMQKLEPNFKPYEVEYLLKKYPSVFRQELTGIGAKMERKWMFNGFSEDGL